MNRNKTKILFFIGSLKSGGKERRLIELLVYLEKCAQVEMMVVVTADIVDFPYFFELDVDYKIIKKSLKKADITICYKFYKICEDFKPDIIHTWGAVQTFYTLPTVLTRKIPLVNSQITSAPPPGTIDVWSWLMDRVNFKFSNIITSNSKAGLRSFKPPMGKSRVIYNGINLNRFENLPEKMCVKAKYNITTPYTVVMVASLSRNKDYGLFYRIAERVSKIRNDITFVGAGAYFETDPVYRKIKELNGTYPNIIFLGRVEEVEALVNSCDVGVLFSPNGEGISNAIMEYMALSKPVVANDAGGTAELVVNDYNGYLIKEHTEEELTDKILELVNDQQRNLRFGANGRRIIEENFSLAAMGEAFFDVYRQVLGREIIKKLPVGHDHIT